MKRILLFIILSMGIPLVLSGQVPELPANHYIVLGDKLNVRESSSLRSSVAGQLRVGTIVKVTERSSEWKKIGGNTGQWVKITTETSFANSGSSLEGWVFDYFISDIKKFRQLGRFNHNALTVKKGAATGVYTFFPDGTYSRDNGRKGRLHYFRTIIIAYNGSNPFQVFYLKNSDTLCTIPTGKYDSPVCSQMGKREIKKETISRIDPETEKKDPPIETHEDIRITPPANKNFLFIGYNSSINNPSKDRRCFYQVLINKVEQGKTNTGLETQKKKFSAKLVPNRHLLIVKKWVLNRRTRKYVRVNNIQQPKPNFTYFNLEKNSSVVIIMREGKKSKARFSIKSN
ncbi:MAG: SH3 domain-containing protein [bacterium]|nr:SH3 domain-containing protein [bacterium]